MWRIPLISMMPVVAACSGEPFQAELPACRCEAEGCAPDECSLRVIIDPSCEGQLPFAEVWVDGHVESGTVTIAEPLTTCSRIPLGGSVQVAVRGGAWIWGPLTESCVEARATRNLLLQCSDAPESPAPAGPD
jgi:hypothetical protein